MSKDDDMNSRLSTLEAENRALRARLDKLDPPPEVVRPPRDPVGPRIVNYIAGVSENLPSEDEAAALLRIIVARYPQLKMRDPDDEVRSFRSGLAFVFTLTRTEIATVKYSDSWWTDTARIWCTQVGLSSPRWLLPAIIGSRAVPYCFDDGVVWLDPYGRGTTIDDQAWRAVLAGGDLLPPMKNQTPVDETIGHRRVIAAAW